MNTPVGILERVSTPGTILPKGSGSENYSPTEMWDFVSMAINPKSQFEMSNFN